MSKTSQKETDVSVRSMKEQDLTRAREIFRIAFGIFLGVPDPGSFWADREYIFTRWHSHSGAAQVAELHGDLAGSNFVTRWGSFGFFGPLTIRPELWDRGIAQKLLEPTMDLFDTWGVSEAGLFTFPQSAKHIGLYQKFGFWPRFLTSVMAKDLNGRDPSWTAFVLLSTNVHKISELGENDRVEAEQACRRLTDSIYAGLDVTSEVQSVLSQKLGETVLLWGGDLLDAFAVCHCGEGTEAGLDTCYIKFAAIRPGPGAEKMFERLLEACESFAVGRGLHRMEAGVNLGRSLAYRQMLRYGFRTQIQGVAMHRPDMCAYNLPDVYVLDDWR